MKTVKTILENLLWFGLPSLGFFFLISTFTGDLPIIGLLQEPFATIIDSIGKASWQTEWEPKPGSSILNFINETTPLLRIDFKTSLIALIAIVAYSALAFAFLGLIAVIILFLDIGIAKTLCWMTPRSKVSLVAAAFLMFNLPIAIGLNFNDAQFLYANIFMCLTISRMKISHYWLSEELKEEAKFTEQATA